MRIQLFKRVVIRDADTTSKLYMSVKHSYKEEIAHYYSSIIPRIGEVIAVKGFNHESTEFYDVVSVIHFYNTYSYHGTADNYDVEIEVTPHVKTHSYNRNDGYVVTEPWPLISELEDRFGNK